MFTVSVTQCSLEQVGGEQHKLQEAQQHLERQECVRADEASRSGAGEKAADCFLS